MDNWKESEFFIRHSDLEEFGHCLVYSHQETSTGFELHYSFQLLSSFVAGSTQFERRRFSRMA